MAMAWASEKVASSFSHCKIKVFLPYSVLCKWKCGFFVGKRGAMHFNRVRVFPQANINLRRPQDDTFSGHPIVETSFEFLKNRKSF